MLVFATSVVTSFLVDGSKKVSTYIVKGSKWRSEFMPMYMRIYTREHEHGYPRT